MKPICKFLLDPRALNFFWGGGVIRGIFWGVCISQKLLRIQKYVGNHLGFFDLSILCALKANLGHLDTFLGGMLESKLPLNNLNFKCYIKFFLSENKLDQKKGRGQYLPPPQAPLP